MSWDCNLHRLAVLTCRVPTCTSPSCVFLPQVVVPGIQRRGFCPSLILALPLGTPLPSFSPGLEQPWLWLPSWQGERRDLVAAPHSAWCGRGGSWEAPCAHLVCGESREGKSPRCFEQEQNSQSTWMPFGVRLFSRSRAGAGAAAGAVSEERPGRGSRRWVCVRPGGREGRMEAAPGGASGSPRSRLGSPQLRSTPAPSQLRCRFPFISGRPPCPLLTGI